MGTIPGSSHPVPDGAYSPSVSGLSWMQDVTEATARQAAYDQVFPSMQSAKTSLFDNFVGKLFQGFSDVLNGLNPASWLPSSVSTAAQTIRDGQLGLKDLVSRLSPLEEYASAFMPSTEGLWQGGRLPFTEVLVGSKGVTANSGRFILNDYGMWRIDCQIWPSNYAVGMISGVEWEIRVLRPDGSVYHRKRSRHVDTDSLPDKLTTTVVVPAVGYSVEVQVTSIAPLRGMRGGADRTHLTVHHINRITSGSGATGETG